MKLKAFISVLAVFVALGLSAQAKYVFFFIGDGMGMGHVNAAEYYNRLVLGNDQPLLMMQFPVASYALTYSASSKITDSAAAGTALSTGNKTKNGMIAMNPDTMEVVSIARKLKDEGWGVGILSSNAPDDATPASFYAHVPNRKMYADIDRQAAASGYDFLGGASLRGLKDKSGNDTGVADDIKKAGIEVIYGTDAYDGKSRGPLWVLSPDGVWGNNNDIGFIVDSIKGAMKLEDLTRVALDHVYRNSPDKFFIMVENGLIDHGAHANDAGAVVTEVFVLQDAIKVAYDFYLQHPDETLIVVTADHDTGGIAISDGNRDMGNIGKQGISKDHFADYWRDRMNEGNVPTWGEMKQMLSDRLGFWTRVPVTKKQTATLKELFDKNFIKRQSNDEKGLYNTFNDFISEVFKVNNYWLGMSFISGSHTANPVPVFAIGVGADKFKGMHNNIELPEIIYEITCK